MKRKLIALLAVFALGSGMITAFAVFQSNVLTGPTVTVTAPTPLTLAFTTTPPTTATLGAQSYATLTVTNTNGKQLSDFALFVNVTGTGVTGICASSGTCVTVVPTVVSSTISIFFVSPIMTPCFGPPCPPPNSTPQEDLFTPMTVPAGTTLITLAITYNGAGTFITHVAFIPCLGCF